MSMNYSKVTGDEFAIAVRDVARKWGTDALLDMPGVREIVSEELNNEALDQCPSAFDDDETTNKED